MKTITLAVQRGLSPQCFADNRQTFESFWRHEQDSTSDMVRQMSARRKDPDYAGGALYNFFNPPNGVYKPLHYLNVFITIALAE